MKASDNCGGRQLFFQLHSPAFQPPAFSPASPFRTGTPSRQVLHLCDSHFNTRYSKTRCINGKGEPKDVKWVGTHPY